MEVSLTGEAQKKAQNRVGCYLDPKGVVLCFLCVEGSNPIAIPVWELKFRLMFLVCTLTLK